MRTNFLSLYLLRLCSCFCCCFYRVIFYEYFRTCIFTQQAYDHRFVCESIGNQPKHSPSPLDQCCRGDPLQRLSSLHRCDMHALRHAQQRHIIASVRGQGMCARLRTNRLTFLWLARQSVVPIPHHFLLPVPHTVALPQSMHRPVPARKAEGISPQENPPVLVLHGPLLQFSEHMGPRSLWCRERTVAYT